MRRTGSTTWMSLFWLLWLGCFGACGDVRLESSVERVSPTSLYTARNEILEINGIFETQLSLSAQNGAMIEQRQFSVALVRFADETGQTVTPVRYPLTDVTYQDRHTLHARSPDDLQLGSYRLEVTDPSGYPARVPEDLTIDVPLVQPAGILLTPNSRSTSAGGVISVDVRLVNEALETVRMSTRIRVEANSPYVEFRSLEMAASFTSGTKDSPEGTISWFEAWLDESGLGRFDVTTSVARSYTLTGTSPDVSDGPALSPIDITVVPDAFDHLDVVLFHRQELLPCDDSGTEPSDSSTFCVGTPFGVTVSARNEIGEPVALNSSFDLLDALTGEPPSLMTGAYDTLELVDGVWTGSLIYLEETSTRLLALGPNQKYGFSDPFEVITGPPRVLSVKVITTDGDLDLVAGERFSLTATQSDGYGNEVPYAPGMQLFVSDQTETLRCDAPEIVDSRALFSGCFISKAISPDHIYVWTAQQIAGSVRLDAVRAASPQSVDATLVTASSSYSTEQGVAVRVDLKDEYGNIVPLSDTSALFEGYASTGESLEVRATANLVNGSAEANLQFTKTATGAYIQASIPALTLVGVTPAFNVVPGSLKGFIVRVCPETAEGSCILTAGLPADALVYPVDQSQNVTGGVTSDMISLTVSPETTLSTQVAPVLTPRSDGGFDVRFVVTRAASAASLIASDFGSISGSSNAFQVVPNSISTLKILQAPPFRWAREPFVLTVEARDAYENWVPSIDGTLRIEATNNVLEPVRGVSPSPVPGAVVGQLVNGVFEGEMLLTAVAESTVLSAHLPNPSNGSTVTGSATPAAVYARDCTPIVTLTMVVDGAYDDAVTCMPARIGGFGPASVTFQAVVTGVPSLIWWDYGDGVVVSSDQQPRQQNHDYAVRGRYRTFSFAVDRNFCAAQDQVILYVNHDDGSPTGPLQLSAASSVLVSGVAGDQSQTSIGVKAVDCQGDPASASVQASPFKLTALSSLGRVSAAQLSGSSSVPKDLSADQAGIQFELGRQDGVGTLWLDLSLERYAGMTRVVTSYLQGLAVGLLSIEAVNDQVLPFVVEYAARGQMSGTVSELLVVFSEAVRGGSSLSSIPFSATSTLRGDLPITSLTLSPDGRALTLGLETPLVLQEGEVVSVTLPSSRTQASVMDVDGNRLDGNFSGSADDQDSFVWRFGPGLDPFPLSGTSAWCELSTDIFSPDSQDGSGAAANQVMVSGALFPSTSLRAFAIVLREAPGGEVIAMLPRAALGTELELPFQVSWAGRDLAGQVLPNGFYDLELVAIDSSDNWQVVPCGGDSELVLEIANPVDLGGYP